MTRDEILALIDIERSEQAKRWTIEHCWGFGDCSSDHVSMVVKAAVLGEEAGEVLQAVLNAGPVGARTDAAVRTEVVQVAAVAFAILEGM